MRDFNTRENAKDKRDQIGLLPEVKNCVAATVEFKRRNYSAQTLLGKKEKIDEKDMVKEKKKMKVVQCMMKHNDCKL